jgi:hypothetical protein
VPVGPRADFFCAKGGRNYVQRHFQNDSEIQRIVQRLESCDFEKGEFTHPMHLAVAAWYLSRYSPEEALSRMRTALVRLTNKFGVKAYHETITCFWLRLVHNFLISQEGECAITDSVNGLISRFARKDAVYEYYSRDLLMSDSARSAWVEPDLKLV